MRKQQIEPVPPFEYGFYLGASTFCAEVDFGKGLFDASFSQNLQVDDTWKFEIILVSY